MPIISIIDKDSGIVHTTFEGYVSLTEIMDNITSLINRPDFVPGLKGISDLRYCSIDLHSADIKKIADLIITYSARIGPSKTAVVVSHDAVYGMTRMFQVFVDNTSLDIAIFRDLKKALQWLGIDNAPNDKS